MCPKAWAITLGVLCAVDGFLLVALPLSGMPFLWWNQAVLNLLNLPGITLSWGGAFTGIVWGFIIGAITGWLIAVLHNCALAKWGCR